MFNVQQSLWGEPCGRRQTFYIQGLQLHAGLTGFLVVLRQGLPGPLTLQQKYIVDTCHRFPFIASARIKSLTIPGDTS